MSRRLRVIDGRLHAIFPFDLALKDWVKGQGARFDATSRAWTFPLDRAAEMVPLLLGRGFVADPAVDALVPGHAVPPVVAPVPAGGAASAVASTAIPVDAMPVRALNARVADALRDAFPTPLRVVGELSGYRPRGETAHVWFDLLDRDPDAGEAVRVSAVMFASTRARVERRMLDAGVTLQDGVRVLLVVRVELFQRDGRFQIVVEDIDPTWTVGDLVARRDAVIQAITAEGLLERNRSLPMPSLPLRIALLTSRGSDAYHDVVSVLQASGFAFRVALFDIRVQGVEVEPTVLAQLALVASNRDRFDLCLITRGGGSRVELGAFDNVNIARAVAKLPLKVMVAIGHQQDTTALDALVESRRTPTDAARSLVELLTRAEQRAEELFAQVANGGLTALRDSRDALARLGRRLDVGSRQRLRAERDWIERDAVVRIRVGVARRLQRASARVARAGMMLSPARVRRSLRAAERLAEAIALRIVRGARLRLSRETVQIGRVGQQLTKAPRAVLRHENERLAGASMRVRLLDPARVLARGYAIVTTQDGTALTSANAAGVGMTLRVQMRDGALGVQVQTTETTVTKEVADDGER